MISLIKAQELIKNLCKVFSIRITPLVKFARADCQRSWYYETSNEIHLSKNRANIDSVLHEFAHVFVNDRNGKKGHSKYFVEALVLITDYHYGNTNKYAWRWEYPRVRKYYKTIIDTQ